MNVKVQALLNDTIEEFQKQNPSFKLDESTLELFNQFSEKLLKDCMHTAYMAQLDSLSVYLVFKDTYQ